MTTISDDLAWSQWFSFFFLSEVKNLWNQGTDNDIWTLKNFSPPPLCTPSSLHALNCNVAQNTNTFPNTVERQ